MLPSVRLMFATFLFGFVVVFAGLRFATLTRIAHVSLPGLSTPVIAAPAPPLVPNLPPAPPIAWVPADDPPRLAFTVPVLFSLESVISATAVAPASAPADVMPLRAELTPLAILPEIAVRSVPGAAPRPAEVTPVPADLAPPTIPPTIALRSEPDATPIPAELTPPTTQRQIALQPAPATAPVDPGPAVTQPGPAAAPDVKTAESVAAETPVEAPEAKASEPLAAAAPTKLAALAENTGAFEPPAPPSFGIDALNGLAEAPPVTVLIRLPLPKKPLLVKTKVKAKAKTKIKTKTVSVRPLWPVRQAGARDPFSLTFGDPLRPF